jgi:hypothetical protein
VSENFIHTVAADVRRLTLPSKAASLQRDWSLLTSAAATFQTRSYSLNGANYTSLGTSANVAYLTLSAPNVRDPLTLIVPPYASALKIACACSGATTAFISPNQKTFL